MSIFSWISDLLGGASEHAQNASESVQNLADNEAVQNVTDQASELGGQAQDLAGNLGEQAQGAVDGVKDKLGL